MRRHPLRRTCASLLALLLVVAGLAACGDDGDAGDPGPDPDPGTEPAEPDGEPSESGESPTADDDPPGAADLTGAAFAQAGSLAVGVRDLDLDPGPDGQRRRAVVWYPADEAAAAGQVPESIDLLGFLPEGSQVDGTDAEAGYPTVAIRDLPVAAGSHPALVFSHGFGAVPEVYQFLATHLASWGIVVVAPDHLERGFAAVFGGELGQGDDAAVLRAALDTALAHPELGSAIDPDRLAIGGQSAGSRGAALAAADDDRYRALVLQSPLGGLAELLEGVDLPTTVMAAVEDQVTPLAAAEELATAIGARLVTISPTGHVSFTDGCALGGDDGGLAGRAQALGVEIPPVLLALAADGCGDGALEPEAGWAPIRHVTTAVLRAAWGIDDAPVGLDADALAELAPAEVTITPTQ